MRRSRWILLSLVALLVACATRPRLFVPAGSAWRYLDDGSDPGPDWRDPGFDDSAWAEAPAELGFGDGDERTVLRSEPKRGRDRRVTTYFRHAFEVSDTRVASGLRLRLLRDDGAIVHLNGTEVLRSNMPEGPVSPTTTASAAVAGYAESSFFETALDPSLLIAGRNVLAVQVHQAGPRSSDLSFDLYLVETDGRPVVTRGPYLQRGTPTTVTIRWRTRRPTISRVVHGPAPERLNREVRHETPTIEHEVTLTGLEPRTRYYYAIGGEGGFLAGGDESHSFVTSPRVGSDLPTRVWVLGDGGTADLNARAVRDAYRSFAGPRRTDVWLMLGDNAYDRGTDREYQRAVFDMYPEELRSTVLWPALGNHDGYSASAKTQSGVYFDTFTLPRRGEAGGLISGTEAYYSFDYGNIHFVCLDSHDSDRSTNGAMMTWLAADLADTLADWIIAYWHHPPYSKGSHDSDDEIDSGGRLRDMREIALPILEAGGVDLVLSGHSHSYERSFLVDGHYGSSDTLDRAAMVLDGGDGRPEGDGAYTKPPGVGPHEGAVYIVAGTSGKTGGGSLDHPVMFTSLTELGSLVLDIEGRRLDATFVNADGVVRDTLTIDKDDRQTRLSRRAGSTPRRADGPSPRAQSVGRRPGASSP